MDHIDFKRLRERRGIVVISQGFKRVFPEEVKAIQDELYLDEIDYEFRNDVFRFIGCCWKFDPIQPGEIIPHYSAIRDGAELRFERLP